MPPNGERVGPMKKYFIMTKSESALILKLILCTSLATAFSWAVGDVHNPTTAVTANLCLYVDRGYRGSLLYAARRILAQIIQGVLVLMLILPCKYCHLPISDGVLILIACCFAIAVGLPLNFKHTYAPSTAPWPTPPSSSPAQPCRAWTFSPSG